MRRIKSWLPCINDDEFQHLRGTNIKRKAGLIAWENMPIVILALIQGIPLDGNIASRELLFAEQIFERPQASSTSLGFESSVIPSLILGGLYLFAVLMLIRSYRSLGVYLLRRYWPLVMQVLLMGIGMVWAEYAGKVALNVAHNVGVIAISLLTAIHFRHEPRRMLSVLGLALGINIIFHLLVVLLFPDIGIANDGRWAGLFSNSNSFGAVAYCAVWANAAAVASTRNLLRLSHVVILCIAAIALIGSGSTTSILSTIVALGILFSLKGSSRRNLLTLSSSAVLLSFAIVIYELFASQGILELIGRTSDLTGRTYIWAEGLNAFLTKPLIGWGFDDNAYVNQVTGMVHPSYHNGYLDLAVRGGAVSLVLFVAIMIIGIRAILRTQISSRPTISSTFLSFILSVLLYNFSEGSFFAPRTYMWAMLLTVLFLAVMSSMKFRNPASKITS